MAIPFTNARVTQINGNRDEVLSSPSAEYTKTNSDIGVILMTPLTESNGGPTTSNLNLPMYNITGTDNNKDIKIENLRYIGKTPNGNAQFTTQ